jgi:hypothetical protein
MKKKLGAVVLITVIFLFGIFILISKPSNSKDNSLQNIENKLEELEFFILVEGELKDESLRTFRENYKEYKSVFNYDRYDSESILGSTELRAYGIDAENLAEGGLEKYLNDMSKTFEALGIDMTSETNEFSTTNYIVTVNDKEYIIFDSNDMMNSNFWWIASKQFIQILNENLETNSKDERVFIVNAGNNDQMLIFLTVDQKEYLNQITDLNIKSLEEIESAVY